MVDGDVGRQLYASVPYIEKLKEQDLLKDTVLIGLGTNGSFSEAQFDSVMDAIGDRKYTGSMSEYRRSAGKMT